MKEASRIASLFEDLYNGDPWLGVTLVETLETIATEGAAKKIDVQWNSIWEIINHVISYREDVLQRVQGNISNVPDDNFFRVVTDQSDTAWKNTLLRLQDSQDEWIAFLKEVDDDELEKIYANNNASYYKNIHGIIQHDAYHLGQIVMLAKAVRASTRTNPVDKMIQ